MENLLNNVSEIIEILLLCLTISILPSIIIRICVKLIKIFLDFIGGNNRVKF